MASTKTAVALFDVVGFKLFPEAPVDSQKARITRYHDKAADGREIEGIPESEYNRLLELGAIAAPGSPEAEYGVALAPFTGLTDPAGNPVDRSRTDDEFRATLLRRYDTLRSAGLAPEEAARVAGMGWDPAGVVSDAASGETLRVETVPGEAPSEAKPLSEMNKDELQEVAAAMERDGNKVADGWEAMNKEPLYKAIVAKRDELAKSENPS